METAVSWTLESQPEVHHCPVKNCRYSDGSERYFTTKRLLNQHIEKVHAEKKYICSKCSKGFGTDWLRKNHELCCGKTWTCSCGVKYNSRDSLYSHAKRKDHYLTDDLLLTPKQILALKKLVSTPVVFVIQPIIQQQVSLIPAVAVPSDRRIILPKQTATPLIAPAEITAQNLGDRQEKTHISPASKAARTPHAERFRAIKPERKQKSRLKTAAETQTCEELRAARATNQNPRKLESRGSQCSGRVKKQRVVIESTHTQTTESAVVKMMKKPSSTRSRRKSVAVVTEWENLQPTKSLWSNFEELILPSDKESVKSCSTQTSPNPYLAPAKVMCDSQTTTDDSLLSFSWPLNDLHTVEHSLPFQVDNSGGGNMMGVDPILNDKVLSDSIMCAGNAPLKSFESNSAGNETVGSNFCNNVLKQSTCSSVANNCNTLVNDGAETSGFLTEKSTSGVSQFTESMKMEEELADLDSVLNTMIGNSNDFQGIDSPLLSDTHTQTNLPLDIDYTSILANMETQTTDDFLFSDLEFSDTETQTPWEDISNISQELSSNQLSIEIQTDFSSASFPANRDNSGTLMASSGKHMETQTSGVYQSSPVQFTNSEAQTLAAMSYFFN